MAGLLVAVWLGWLLARRGLHPERPFNANQVQTMTAAGETPALPVAEPELVLTNTEPVLGKQRQNQFVAISGIVLDANGSPLFQAAVSINDYLSRERYEAYGFPSEASTDAQGAWHLNLAPEQTAGHYELRFEHSDFRAVTVSVNQGSSEEQVLRAGKHKVILRRPVGVRGVVTDENGNAISGATIRAEGRPDSVSEGFHFGRPNSTHSDEQGRFAFTNVSEGAVTFTATAEGWQARSKTLKVGVPMEEIVLQLSRGKALRGLVQNEAGEPLPEVRVTAEVFNWVGDRPRTTVLTGDDGRFTVNNSSEDQTLFSFEKQGYAHLRNKHLKLDTENVITLRKPRQVQGIVLDAESGEPIKNCRLAAGQLMSGEQFLADSSGARASTDDNGHFNLSIEEEQPQRAVSASAEGYADRAQEVPPPQNDVSVMEFRLKRSAAVHGKLVTFDGTGVPYIPVAVVVEGGAPFSGASLSNSRLKNQDQLSSAKFATTDGSGEFTIKSPPDTGARIVAATEDGFASAPVEQVRTSGVLMLQAYGAIEGQLTIAGEPSAGSGLLFTLQNIGVSTDFNSFRTETDREGKFKFEKVPPGEGQLVRLTPMQNRGWMHGQAKTVTVQPGATTYVTLGDSGAVIKGHVTLQSPPTDGEQLDMNGQLHTPFPQSLSFTSAAEAGVPVNTPEYKAWMKSRKFFVANIKADGSFMFDSVPAGSYSLDLNAYKAGTGPWSRKSVAAFKMEVTIPENPDPVAPIDLGELILSAPTER